ncbi:alpha/beta hydrolase [Aquabacterium sp. OR-4]|uniref:alpha/beta hydrolase n=1 Tax=Aquabacterium sp. OR-4 TaxID=2978127 RepID=UPI0028C79416|nr:alpha/beta hydrolase-fold protein [Aquabacterium sp. OR-4]MDT7839051.1 alpha/beta hydrolase-fold protein [Aquabacterium sp. OR-4]
MDDTALSLPFVRQHTLRDTQSDQAWCLAIAKTAAAEARCGDATGAAHRLLLVLDGNLAVAPAALMQQSLAERARGLAPRSTLVGVGYPGVALRHAQRRAQDFLPPWPAGLARPADAGDFAEGQADRFARFLDAQLLPWLATHERTQFTEVGLFGHSFGGLFALHKLLHRPGPMQAFFAVSPSLWWADGWLQRQPGGTAAQGAGRSLWLGIGSDERALPGDDAARQALHRRRDMQGRFAQLVAQLQHGPVALQAEVLAGEDHGSVLYPALTRAVRWLMQPVPQPDARHSHPSHTATPP